MQELCANKIQTRYGNLSTQVDANMWISVDNLFIKALAGTCVDKWYLKTHTYTHLIHNFSLRLSSSIQSFVQKKLDLLSTYPQRLLQILMIKISFI